MDNEGYRYVEQKRPFVLKVVFTKPSMQEDI